MWFTFVMKDKIPFLTKKLKKNWININNNIFIASFQKLITPSYITMGNFLCVIFKLKLFRLHKVFLYFSSIWSSIVEQNVWRKKLILRLQTISLFQIEKIFTFDCFCYFAREESTLRCEYLIGHNRKMNACQ